MKRNRKITALILCIICIIMTYTPFLAADNVEKRVVKVGFFQSDGYHIMDDNGTRSGYGYDFLQMLLRYNDWEYDYVGYDKNWSDMLGMLENGDIDMVTLANKTPEREAQFAFSDEPIGSSSTIMSINSSNKSIIAGDYSTYNNAVVGLVENSVHNEYFEEYARENGFSYTVKYYADAEDVLSDLRAGINIDIAVTSNMRVLQDEVVLDEFNSENYYAVVRKEDKELLDEINSGIAQLNIYSNGWRTSLFNKYFGNINENVISFSADERKYLENLKKENVVIKAAMNPELKPYSYFEDGEAKGIVPRLFDKIAENVGIDYEIVYSKDRWEYKEQLNSGYATLDLTSYLDFGLAQKYNLKETDAYINSTLAMLSRNDSNSDSSSMKVAVVKDPTEYIGYNNELIYQYDYDEYDSIDQCIEAVKNGKADATFVYIYIAELAIANDYTNRLQYSTLTNHPFGLSVGVNSDEDHRLLSVMNKGVNSLSDDYTQSVMIEETSGMGNDSTLIAVVYDHPAFVMFLVVLALLVIFIIIILAVHNKSQKAALLAAHEIQRFISYICESYELVAEVNLQTRERIEYRMNDGELEELHIKYIPLDEDYFKDIVRAEDLDRIVEAFSEKTIEKMIGNGGEQNYLELQMKAADGSFRWYSLLIKAVPRDMDHPCSFVVFKNDIEDSKRMKKSRESFCVMLWRQQRVQARQRGPSFQK